MPIEVGDVVRFKDIGYGLSGQKVTVKYVEGNICELVQIPGYRFSLDGFELVQKCKYKTWERVTLKGVFWNESTCDFVVEDIVGQVKKNGFIDFEERTLDLFGVPVTKIGKMYSAEESSGDFDVVICEPDEKEVLRAKTTIGFYLAGRIKETKKELEEQERQYEALKQRLKENYVK